MLTVQEKSLSEWRAHRVAEILKTDLVRETAYQIWEQMGRPDGEQPVSPSNPLLVREQHWKWALAYVKRTTEIAATAEWIGFNGPRS